MSNDLAAIMAARRSAVDAATLGDDEYLDCQPLSVKNRPKRSKEQMQLAMEARREHIDAMEDAARRGPGQEAIDADIALARGSELLNKKERAARVARASHTPPPEPTVVSASTREALPQPKPLLAPRAGASRDGGIAGGGTAAVKGSAVSMNGAVGVSVNGGLAHGDGSTPLEARCPGRGRGGGTSGWNAGLKARVQSSSSGGAAGGESELAAVFAQRRAQGRVSGDSDEHE